MPIPPPVQSYRDRIASYLQSLGFEVYTLHTETSQSTQTDYSIIARATDDDFRTELTILWSVRHSDFSAFNSQIQTYADSVTKPKIEIGLQIAFDHPPTESDIDSHLRTLRQIKSALLELRTALLLYCGRLTSIHFACHYSTDCSLAIILDEGRSYITSIELADFLSDPLSVLPRITSKS